MFKNLKKQSEGFTIIEVMIVLVIAAVILLIVFLAVPALQRNSRNTQRKNDVAGVLSALNESANNNGGKYPTNALGLYAAMQNAKLGFYTYDQNSFGNVVSFSAPTVGATVTNDTTTETIKVAVNADCNGANAVGKNRTIAVLYSVETGSSPQQVCQSE
jgi:prepilin-type N-terminal cleavage/methylation domain-containing protein